MGQMFEKVRSDKVNITVFRLYNCYALLNRVKIIPIFLSLILLISCQPKKDMIFGFGLKDNLINCSNTKENIRNDTVISHPSNRFSIHMPQNWSFYLNIMDSVNGITGSDPNPIIDETSGKIKYLRTIGVTEIGVDNNLSLHDQFNIEIQDFIKNYPQIEIIDAGFGNIQMKECIWTKYRDLTDTLGIINTMNYMFKNDGKFYIIETTIYGDSILDNDFCELRKYVATLEIK